MYKPGRNWYHKSGVFLQGKSMACLKIIALQINQYTRKDGI